MHTIDNPQGLPASLIYKYDNRTNHPWQIQQYKVPRQYLDPNLEVKKRQWATQKKGQKDRKYTTKRGFYMDYDLKVASGIPSPLKHGSNNPWSFQKLLSISKHKKIDKNLLKRTYLDQIQIQQKNRKKPGVCTYSLEKSLKQKEAQIEQMKKRKSFVGQKHFFYEDITFLGDKSPGSGNYNPHDNVVKLRMNKTQYKDFLKKHHEQKQKYNKRISLLPAPGTYNPMNATFTTFDLISKDKQQDKSKSKQKSNGFGTDARFEYIRPDKKKIKQKRPDPISYNTAYGWRQNKGSPKNKPWNQSLYKGFQTFSIYH